MKALLLVPLLLFGVLPVEARQQQAGFSNQCFDRVYREEYIPGTRRNPGRVKTWTETVEVPCDGGDVTYIDPVRRYGTGRDHGRRRVSRIDNNSCVEGSLIGGLAGGALGGTLATKDNWIWSIPAGVIGGAMVGCQVDGG